MIDLVRAHDLVELLEREVEAVFRLAQHAGLHEAFGFLQQRLLVHERATDQAVLRILAIADERANAIDPPLGLCSLVLAVRQRAQPIE